MDDSTPFYPGWHQLGSRIWTSDERDPQPPLGEANDAKHVYSSGVPYIERVASPVLLGSADCLATGETEPPDPTRVFYGGWDSRCFVTLPEPPPPTPQVDVRYCRTQQNFALIENLLYAPGGQVAQAQLLIFYPMMSTFLVPNSPQSIPGSLIGVQADLTLVFISGTTNFLQWGLQAFYGSLGPFNQGLYSTLLLWDQAADAIQLRIDRAMGSSTGPMVFVGHSYGGAVACILAARYRARTRRQVQLLTFGCPKPGDARMIALLEGSIQVHLVNDADAVPYLPPSGEEAGLLAWFFPQAILGTWSLWERPRFRIGLRADGTRYDNPDPGNIYNLLYQVALSWLGSRPFPNVFQSHYIEEYQRRILCPNQVAPTPEPVSVPLLWLTPEALIGTPPATPVALWQDWSGAGNDVSQGDPSLQPIWTTSFFGGFVGVVFRGNALMTFPTFLPINHDYAAYVLAVPHQLFSGDFAGPEIITANVGGEGAPNCTSLGMHYNDNLNHRSLVTAIPTDLPALWMIRRSGSSLELSVLDGPSASAVINPAGRNGPLGIRASTLVSSTARDVCITEVILYPYRPSDADHAGIIEYFRLKYSLFP